MENVTTIDARGLRCPLPVLRLAAAARDAAPGRRFDLIADDAAAENQDIGPSGGGWRHVGCGTGCTVVIHRDRGADSAGLEGGREL